MVAVGGVPFFSFLELGWVAYAGPIVAAGHSAWERFLENVRDDPYRTGWCGDVADDSIETARALETFAPCPWWREL